METLNIGLNGFGRIGRAFARIALDKKLFNIVTINTRNTPAPMLAYLLQYDSVYRTYTKQITHDENSIAVDGIKIATSMIREPRDIPWEKYGVDVVIDATGVFKTRDKLKDHLRGSVKKVIVTAPVKDDSIPHIVLGVNNDSFDFKHVDIISNASCTTNCAAPMFQIIHDNFKIISGFLTTAHAYTITQQLLDNSSKEFTRARAATLSIIPSTTGAADAIGKTIPEINGKIDGMAIRVPTPVGSFSDISAVTEKSTTIEEVNSFFKHASQENMKGILDYATIPLVSSDYIGSPYSCIFDANYTKVINGNLVKVFGWYDNEWGYSSRLVDLVTKLAAYLP
ncbi:MAG TPA: type I glyceraldehyde-3-phosphate dehydrogenase [Patescibacteria group bacterium]|nr:type I glyceraldehyde-3-phosphate dehydrogenase [Patescibacteria group bacterium]